MGVLKKSPEERAEADARYQAILTRRHSQDMAQAETDELQAFQRSHVGQARTAYERGDTIFQCSIDVMSQEAIVFLMRGSNVLQDTTDPLDVLNSICREGWELVNGSFVFVEEGQLSRDKFLSSGQHVATRGHHRWVLPISTRRSEQRAR